MGRSEDKSPIRSSIEEKPKRQISTIGTSKLDERKVKKYINEVIPSIE